MTVTSTATATVTSIAVQSMSPDRAQGVFRAVLDAFARPGTVHRLPAGSLASRVPAALLPVLALADLSTPVCVLADEGSGWAEVVRAATGAPVASLPAARLVSVLRHLAPGELTRLRTGTAAAPEDGALAVLAVGRLIPEAPEAPEDLENPETTETPDAPGTTRLRLTGPGVPGTRGLRVSGLPADFAASRAGLVSGFPVGVDLLLVTADGAVAGLPRTTTAEATEETS